LAGVPDDYPVLGAMKRLSRRLAGDPKAISRVMNDPYIMEGHLYKAFGVGVVDRSEVLNAIAQRYGVCPTDVEEMETMISNVSRLPVFLSHPGFNRFRDVDYPA